MPLSDIYFEIFEFYSLFSALSVIIITAPCLFILLFIDILDNLKYSLFLSVCFPILKHSKCSSECSQICFKVLKLFKYYIYGYV